MNFLAKPNILTYIIKYSLIAQLVKNPPEMQETMVKFLGREDLLADPPPPPFIIILLEVRVVITIALKIANPLSNDFCCWFFFS